MDKKTVETKAKPQAKPFQQAAKPYELPPLKAEVVEEEQLTKVKTNSRYKNAAPVSDVALEMSAKMLADLGQGQRVPVPKELQDQKAAIKQRLQLDLSRILTRNGHQNLSVRVADEGSSLVFWYAAKRVQKPKEKDVTGE